jgi:putative Mg2+ transporter-C (MgtC) family protein
MKGTVMSLALDAIVKILLAVLLGGAIGLERELHQKAAGFRTITLICTGAALLTMLDAYLNASGRIVANIVTGIGFLGGGVILHDANRIRGLTTAASVWLAAALGIAVGSGVYGLAVFVAAVALIVMAAFRRLERWIDGMRETRIYQIVTDCEPAKGDELDAAIKQQELRVGLRQQMKVNGKLVYTMEVTGATAKQNEFVRAVITDPGIDEIKW